MQAQNSAYRTPHGSTHGFDVEKLVQLVLTSLNQEKERYKSEFKASQAEVGTRFVAIDDLLPESVANEIFEKFPGPDAGWTEADTFREKKLTTRAFDKLPSLLGEISFAIQDPRVLKVIHEITQIPELRSDVSMYAGGLSLMREGDFLNPHIDNSHDGERKLYRRINLLYYVSPDWHSEDGGHLELWKGDVKTGITIESRFNRLVLMETNHTSWHSVSPVLKPGGLRTCVSNYYFSRVSPQAHEYFHVTSFQGRPEQHVRRLRCSIDNCLRMAVRSVIKSGLKKKDVFTPSNQISNR